jgi:uncharacterized protein
MNIRELREKAESGGCIAQTVLGICYLDGIGTEVDYREAFRLLSDAATQGAPRAIANLARMHADGLGIPQNNREAIRLYEVAADAGEFLAQIELGRIYSRGTCVPPNSATARRWYEQQWPKKMLSTQKNFGRRRPTSPQTPEVELGHLQILARS